MVTSPEGTEIPAGKSAFLNSTFCRAILPFAVNFSYCSFSIYWYFPSKERSVVKIPFNVMSFNGKAFFKLSKLITPFMPPFNVGSSGLTTSRFMLNGLVGATVKVKTSGEFQLSLSAKGEYYENHLPAFDLRFNILNANLKYPDLPESVEKINLKLAVTNPVEPSAQTRQI